MVVWKETDRWIPVSERSALAGDFVIYGGRNFPAGHVGIVVKADLDGVTTIEGNDANEVRLHDGVQHPRRKWSDILGFGMPEYDLTTITKYESDPACYVQVNGEIGDYIGPDHPYAQLIDLGIDINVRLDPEPEKA